MEQDIIQKEAQDWEKEWWGDCTNTYNEETKQYIYASLMGLNSFLVNDYGRVSFDLGDRTILDIGGGPVSLLLKTKAAGRAVIDPCNYPDWVAKRYEESKIVFLKMKGEDFAPLVQYNEVWIYNVLQHVEDPQKIIKNALACAKIVRLFEWIEAGVSNGHPHNLTASALDEWLGGHGKITNLTTPPCVGLAYSGIFKGDRYDA